MKQTYIIPKIKISSEIKCNIFAGSKDIEATIPDINMEGCFCDDDCPPSCNCDYCSCGGSGAKLRNFYNK